MLSPALGVHSVSLESVFARCQVDGEPNATDRASVLQMYVCTGLFMAENRIGPSNVELHNSDTSRLPGE